MNYTLRPNPEQGIMKPNFPVPQYPINSDASKGSVSESNESKKNLYAKVESFFLIPAFSDWCLSQQVTKYIQILLPVKA